MKTVDRTVVFIGTVALLGWLCTKPRASTSRAHASAINLKEEAQSSPEKKEIIGKELAEKSAGASASGPSEIPAKGWWHVLKRAAAGLSDDRIMTEAAGVTFYTLLALFPSVASFISIYGLVADPSSIADQIQSLNGIVPAGGIEIVKDQVTALTSGGSKTLGWGAIIGLATSLWSANAGMKSLFGALNVVYHEHEKRSFVVFTLTALSFTLGAIAFVIVALLAVVALPIFLNFVGLSSVTDSLLRVLRWPFMLVVITGALALIYRYGPSRTKARWQWVSWGGASAALLWLVASLGFSYYVANFGSYNKTYGTLGAAIGFMTWIWISSIVVLMGAELNAELEQETERDSTIGPEKPRGERGAFKADIKT
ncbi:YihY/virulence factor BrkB family protein [Acidisphaera sp. L21]|uniref:YihY/virulence factor BrkB family protein n=1 Tax=Acidisphaera sp. L21 TaxID=1641851 RepID=UPI00131A66AF|nr:YihY/virulence factor BrkB family protein [Acidisphaera sp. L21]